MSEPKEHLETLLSDYVDGNLAGEQLEIVEAYLNKNPGVRDAVNRIIVDSEALRSLPRVNAPFDFSEDVKGQAERDLLLDGGAISFPRKRRISSVVMSLAAVVLLFLGLGGTLYWLVANRPTPYLDIALNNAAAPDSTPADAAKPAPLARENAPAGSSLDDEQAKTNGPDTLANRDVPGDLARTLPAAPVRTEKAEVKEFEEGGKAVVPAASIPADRKLGAEASSEVAAGALAPGSRKPMQAAPAPADISELVEESPRYNDRAVAMVVSSDDASAINGAVNFFALSNSVRTQALTYDGARNRAILPANSGRVDQTNASFQTQVSGVTTKAAGEGFGDLPHQPQVMMAIGLTADQVSSLKDSLDVEVGKDRLQTFYLREPLERASSSEVAAQSGAFAQPTSRPALIAIGDRLVIEVADSTAKEMPRREEMTVDEQGLIEAPMLEPTHAAGMTLAALRQTLVGAYITKGEVHDPVVRIEWVAPATSQPTDDKDKLEKQAAAGGAILAAEPERFDVYVVLRNGSPATQPAESAPSTQPGQ